MNRLIPFLCGTTLLVACSPDPTGIGDSRTSTIAVAAVTTTSSPMLTDLGTLPGGYNSYALDLNDAGTVVGWSETQLIDHLRAFYWTAGSGMVDLGTLGGDESRAFAVNNSFEIVGVTTTVFTPFGEYVPFYWSPFSGMIALPGSGIATDINDNHVITGCADIDGTGSQVVTWSQSGGSWVATGLGRPSGAGYEKCGSAEKWNESVHECAPARG